MAQKETFFEQRIDRTPYGACVWMAVIMAAIFIVGVVGLWRVSGMVKKSLPKPSINANVTLPDSDAARSAAEEQAESIRAKINNEVTKQKDAAADAAKEAAEAAAREQAQKAADQAKEEFQKALGQ